MKKNSILHLSKKLRGHAEKRSARFAFFIGAGCSVHCGIPTASSLVKDKWLHDLYRYRDDPDIKFEDWLAQAFPDYDVNNPSASYGKIIEERFDSDAELQEEFSDICSGIETSFEHYCLYSLHTKHPETFNVFLTTNFDDLIEEAFRSFSERAPTTIVQEELVNYVQPSSNAATIIKLHGDYRYYPKNKDGDLLSLPPRLQSSVQNLLQDRGIIFLGYSGSDESVKQLLESIKPHALSFPIYWVSKNEPQNLLREWLESVNAIWIKCNSFTEFSLFVSQQFRIPFPDISSLIRNEWMFVEGFVKSYFGAKKAKDSVPTPSGVRVGKAGWGFYEFNARRYHQRNPSFAEHLYKQGIRALPQSSTLHSCYADFLHTIKQNFDLAEKYYRQAIKLNSSNVVALSNYALFLEQRRNNIESAYDYNNKAVLALEIKPSYPDILHNYARFLSTYYAEFSDYVEELFCEAYSIGKYNLHLVGPFAVFLMDQGRYNEAEKLHFSVFSINDNGRRNFNSYKALYLANAANFFFSIRKNDLQSEIFFNKALEYDPNHPRVTASLGSFYLYMGKVKEGFGLFEKFLKGDKYNHLIYDLMILYSFCQILYGKPDQVEQGIAHFKKNFIHSFRSPIIDRHTEKALSSRYKDFEWIKKLCEVIAGEKEPDILNGWDKWANTG